MIQEKKKMSLFIKNIIADYIIGYAFILILFLLIINFAIERGNTFCVICDCCLCVIWGVLMIIMARDQINSHKVKFKLLSNDAVLPDKDDENAGYDIYATFNDKWIVIEPHKTRMIPTGIASAFSTRYVAVLKERGSTGTRGIGQRAGIIDSGYRGEWFVPITNHNNYRIAIVKEEWMDDFSIRFDGQDIEIYPYEKAIAQALFIKVPELEIMQITQEEFDALPDTARGAGALGSSGK